MKVISDFYEHQEFPKVNGIVFPDGMIQLLDVSVDWGPPVKYQLSLSEKESMDMLKSRSELFWNGGAILDRSISKAFGLEVLGGEGDYGSDGFVALLNAESKELVWLAAFDCSNPFDSVKFDGDDICARTTLGTYWRFPVMKPQDVTVE